MSGLTARLFHLDATRSVLMVLIVAMHACAVYTPGNDWIVVSPQGSAWVGYFGRFLDLFVLPGFFVISGLLTMSSVMRRGAGALYGRRVSRLAIPLVATALVVNVPFCLLLRHLGLSDEPVLSAGYWLGGGWILHLWFLINLVFYTLISGPVCLALLALRGRGERLLSRLPRHLVLSVLLLACVAGQLALVAAAWKVPALYDPLFFDSSLYTFGYYYLFFVLGFVVRTFPSLWDMVMRPAPAIYLQAVPVLLAAFLLDQARIDIPLFADAAAMFLTFCLIQFLLSRFRIWFDNPTSLWNALSDSSYTVYLFHHHVVALAAVPLLALALPVEIEFALVLVAGLAAGLITHFCFIARSGLLALLFNGKPMPARYRPVPQETETPAPVAAAPAAFKPARPFGRRTRQP